MTNPSIDELIKTQREDLVFIHTKSIEMVFKFHHVPEVFEKLMKIQQFVLQSTETISHYEKHPADVHLREKISKECVKIKEHRGYIKNLLELIEPVPTHLLNTSVSNQDVEVKNHGNSTRKTDQSTSAVVDRNHCLDAHSSQSFYDPLTDIISSCFLGIMFHVIIELLLCASTDVCRNQCLELVRSLLLNLLLDVDFVIFVLVFIFFFFMEYIE